MPPVSLLEHVLAPQDGSSKRRAGRGWSRVPSSISGERQRKSVVITSNLAFKDWPTCTTALIDRLVHHSEIISIEGESYRKREAEQSKEATETRRREERS